MSEKLTLRLSSTARADLAEIFVYIATEAGDTVATDLLMSMNKTIGVLPQSPSIGTTREQLGAGLRVIFHHPYAIYYQVSGQELIIVRVLHGARDTAAIAEQGGFIH